VINGLGEMKNKICMTFIACGGKHVNKTKFIVHVRKNIE